MRCLLSYFLASMGSMRLFYLDSLLGWLKYSGSRVSLAKLHKCRDFLVLLLQTSFNNTSLTPEQHEHQQKSKETRRIDGRNSLNIIQVIFGEIYPFIEAKINKIVVFARLFECLTNSRNVPNKYW